MLLERRTPPCRTLDPVESKSIRVGHKERQVCTQPHPNLVLVFVVFVIVGLLLRCGRPKDYPCAGGHLWGPLRRRQRSPVGASAPATSDNVADDVVDAVKSLTILSS